VLYVGLTPFTSHYSGICSASPWFSSLDKIGLHGGFYGRVAGLARWCNKTLTNKPSIFQFTSNREDLLNPNHQIPYCSNTNFSGGIFTAINSIASFSFSGDILNFEFL
jgi:hypothetical protein